MPTYRIYFLDRNAHTSRPPKEIECASDQEAIQMARQFIEGKGIELWRDNYRVAKFPDE